MRDHTDLPATRMFKPCQPQSITALQLVFVFRWVEGWVGLGVCT